MVIKLTQWITAILLALFMMFTVQQLAPVFADDTMNHVPYTKCSWDGTKVVDSTEYADNVKVIPADGSKKSPDESSIALGYAPRATSDDISVTASSFGGTVTLNKPFKSSKGGFKARPQDDLTKMAGSALVPWDCGADGHIWDREHATCTVPKTCILCGATGEEALGHDYQDIEDTADAATCTEPGKEADQKCSRCGAVTYGATIPALGHDWGEWAETHAATEEANGEEARTCSVCQEKETRPIPKPDHVHSKRHVDAAEPTCKEAGHIEYWICDDCGLYFSADSDDNDKIIGESDTILYPTGHAAGDVVHENETAATCTTDGAFDEVIYCEKCGVELRRTNRTAPALAPTHGHDWGEWVVTKLATDKAAGEKTRTCIRCGKTETQVIPKTTKPISIKGAKVVLSKTAFTYNGKAQKPSVKTIGGKKLKAGTDYTMTYKNNKNVGLATLTITGKGNYTGTVTKSFKINPKGTSLKKLTKGKKAVTVNWKKQSAKMSTSRITGYQIQLATNKKFTKNKKTVTVKGYKKVSKKVTKLKAKKKYYVKTRTYKTVSGKKYYSPWSKIKTIKTR